MDQKKQYLELSNNQKRLFRFLNSFLLFFLLPFLIIIYFNYAINRPSQTFKEVNYNLKPSSALEDIAKDLKNLGVINSENLFVIYGKIFRIYPKIQAGIYTFPTGSSLIQVINQLQSGSNGVAITFWEGKRLEEYGILASDKLPAFNYERFIEKTKSKEGMLFPDTYFFYPSANEDDVIKAMTDNFEKKISRIKKTEEYQKTSLTDNQIFTIASLLEKEASAGEQQRYIAGIIINRMNNNDRLGIDASNQYGVATRHICPNNYTQSVCPDLETAKTVVWWKPDLTKSDLELDEPFNTRIKRGLPPHPISSFSEEAIMAVLTYIPSNYYYYLHDSSGGVHYAETASEHSSNVSRYIRY